MFHYKGLVGDIDRINNSLSTSNFSEMIKSVHVFMIKGVNQLLTCALLGKAFSQLFYSSS